MAEISDTQAALQAAVQTAGERPQVRFVLAEADAYLYWLRENN